MKTIQQLMQERENIITAERTGYTVEQVRTLNALERSHDRATAADRFGVGARIAGPFKVEHDERLNLPRVSWLDDEHGFPYDAVVLADGSLDYTL
jgi:hypothetical protein